MVEAPRCLQHSSFARALLVLRVRVACAITVLSPKMSSVILGSYGGMHRISVDFVDCGFPLSIPSGCEDSFLVCSFG